MTKICRRCENEKKIKLFSKYSNSKDGYDYYCKACRRFLHKVHTTSDLGKEKRRAQARNWRANNKSRIRNYALKRIYKISIDEYNQILLEQDNRCKICKADTPGFNRSFAVDHCHKTDKVRGLLCQNCNILLGKAKDSIDILNSAIQYLSSEPSLKSGIANKKEGEPAAKSGKRSPAKNTRFGRKPIPCQCGRNNCKNP
jgi:hypothetical protein